LSSQKSRLLEQINDLKSRDKALELELQSMDDTMQTCLTKVEQTNTIIHTMDESLADIQRNISTERNQFDAVEQERKSLQIRLTSLQTQRDLLDASVNQLQQSKEFSK
jgi:chromosome segregation ATPase